MSEFKDALNTIRYITSLIRDKETSSDALALWIHLWSLPIEKRRREKHRLYAELNICEQTFYKAVRQLVRINLLDVDRTHGRTNEYIIKYKHPENKETPTPQIGGYFQGDTHIKKKGTPKQPTKQTGVCFQGDTKQTGVRSCGNPKNAVGKTHKNTPPPTTPPTPTSKADSIQRYNMSSEESIDTDTIILEENESDYIYPSDESIGRMNGMGDRECEGKREHKHSAGQRAQKIRAVQKKIRLSLPAGKCYTMAVPLKHQRALLRLEKQVEDLEAYTKWYVAEKIERAGKGFSWGLFLYPAVIDEFLADRKSTDYLRTTSKWKSMEAGVLERTKQQLKRIEEATKRVQRERQKKVV